MVFPVLCSNSNVSVCVSASVLAQVKQMVADSGVVKYGACFLLLSSIIAILQVLFC